MRPRHVVICLLDAATTHHMSLHGYHRRTTPVIDELAKESVVFHNCFSPGNYTMVGCGSVHTGRYAENHGAFYLGRKLKDDDLTFAETMRRAGYTTAGWCSNLYANSYMGFNVGFEHFDEFPELGEDSRKRGSDELFELEQEHHKRLAEWLDTVPDSSVFAYIHFLPPHGDYETPSRFLYTWANPEHAIPDTTGGALMAWEQGKKPYTQRDVDYVRDLYDENMLYADYNVGLVIDRLRDAGMWEDTLFVVLSDHGEAFMEHGFTLHNTTMYDEMIHVPLVVKPHRGFDPVRRDIEALVELIDVYPTVAEMLGVALPDGTVDGRSFLPLMTGGAEKIKDYAFSRSAHSVTPMLSVRTLKHKYIYNQMKETRELYDLVSDPLEKNNIIEQDRQLADEFHAMLEPALEYYRKEREGGQ